MTIYELLNISVKALEDGGIEEPRREASSLMEYAINRNRAYVFAHPEYELDGAHQERFCSFVKRRANREPFHYIVGEKQFFGLYFEVNPDVLIPRPETEMLVQHSIEILKSLVNPVFCEIGVGSGCIAVSILHTASTALAVGLEISDNAIALAQRNAERHRVADRLRLMQSNIYSALNNERFDLIFANPPYIPAADIAGLQPEVRNFEPYNALTDGGCGLSIIKNIVDGSDRFLKPGGFLLFEIGIGQSEAVKQMFDSKLWQEVEIIPDFQSIPRMVMARSI